MAPLVAPAPAGAAPGSYRLTYPGGEVAAEVADGELLAVLPFLAAGETRACELVAGPQADAAVARRDGPRIALAVDGSPVGELLLDGGTKPYLLPLLLPNGQSVTRRVPPDEAAGDVTDHPHHKGLWVAHGDVNGVDFWSDNPRNLGRQVVRSVRCASGPVAARIDLDVDWTAPDGSTVLTERRRYLFWHAGAGARIIDVSSAYVAPAGGAVRFGDTKEGALCCIRLAAGTEGRRGGLITTSAGARTEAEAWGSAGAWCDYSGQPLAEDGRGRLPEVGVAIFDHPQNPLHPTRWHVRDYGLFTANPFGLHDYMPRRGLRGDYDLPGSGATFRYRVYAHSGGAVAADVAGRYADWAWPVKAGWSEGAR